MVSHKFFVHNLPAGRPALCGMIHVQALPGTPRNYLSVGQIVERAVEEARALVTAGMDCLLLENMHDTPYLKVAVGPEIVAAMTAVGVAVRREVPGVALGVQVLAGANMAALAVAQAVGAQFIRAEGFVYGHLGDEGYHDACAAELLRYRRAIGAPDIAILADIKKKHSSHAVTADVSLEDTAEAAAFFGADGLILTGTATGRPASAGELQRLVAATDLPVCVGSGITPDNVAAYRHARILIVGSSIKRDGHWANVLDMERVSAMVTAARALESA
jgi:membrane complex biogenesis BtpA family protein